MRKISVLILLLCLTAGAAIVWAVRGDPHMPPIDRPQTAGFQLSSPAFADGQTIPDKYTAKGEDVSPPLSIAGVPDTAKSLVLYVHDPDAPAKDWVHWLVWNIPAGTTDIAEQSVPSGGIQGTNDFVKTAWGGPAPPSGTHTYRFELFALDTELDLPTTDRWLDAEQAMRGHVVGHAELTGTVTAAAQ